MAKIYYDLIKKSLKTLEDVPMQWRDEVEKLLAADETSTTQEPEESEGQ